MSDIRIVTDPVVSSDLLAEWALERLKDPDIKTPHDLGPFRAFGVMRMTDAEPVPLAVVIYNSFRQMTHGNDMRVIIVAESPSWCLRGVLRELFSYPFVTAGCERLTAVIKDGNSQSLKLCRGLGFIKEGVLRRAYDGKTNAVLLSMLKKECTWLKGQPAERENNGQERRVFATTGSRSIQDSASSGPDEQRGPARKRKNKQRQHLHANG